MNKVVIHSFLPSIHLSVHRPPSVRPSILPSFLPSVRPSVCPSFPPSFLPSFIHIEALDHVYLRHLSTEYRSILSADMAIDSQPIYRPILDRYVGRVSVDMLESVDRQSTPSVDMSVDTRLTPRPICCDRQSLVYWSTVCGVSVCYRWYQSIVNRCLAEIAAVSLPAKDAKEEPIAYARGLIEQGCSSNCCHFENISDFGTIALSSCHMDGFFIFRPCDISQLFLA